MDDLSNRTLALLLVVAIAVSLAGTWMSFVRLGQVVRVPLVTGLATGSDIATVDLTIASVVEVNWTDAAINWGTGSVDGGKTACEIDSDGETGSNNNCTIDPFNSVVTGLVLENR